MLREEMERAHCVLSNLIVVHRQLNLLDSPEALTAGNSRLFLSASSWRKSCSSQAASAFVAT